jgi:hypothetical protein
MAELLNVERTRRNSAMTTIATVRSESNPNITYRVDLIKGECSCPGWTMHFPRRPCKHLRQMGFK